MAPVPAGAFEVVGFDGAVGASGAQAVVGDSELAGEFEVMGFFASFDGADELVEERR